MRQNNCQTIKFKRANYFPSQYQRPQQNSTFWPFFPHCPFTSIRIYLNPLIIFKLYVRKSFRTNLTRFKIKIKTSFIPFIFILLYFYLTSMKTSKLEKNDKGLTNKNNQNPNTNNIKFSYHHYTNLTNQQYLLHALKLLGVTEAEYLKETKLSMNDEIFGKNQSASTTKQFFFIVISCLKYLCNEQQFNAIKIWYPPRTVNEQLEFKKILYNLILKLQNKNKVPKNLVISKNFLMGETPTGKVIQFLRILSQLTLRSQYLERFSKKQSLVEICLKEMENPQKQPNDINQFYVYPFTPGQSLSKPPLEEHQIQSLKKIYKNHIEIYRKKILSLAEKYQKQEPISCQQLMASLVEQKQLAETLTKKIPKSVLSQNRAFDRRKIIDKSRYVWEKLDSISCVHVGKIQVQNVLKLQGEIDKILLKWETPSGVNRMLNIIEMTDKLKALRQDCAKKTQQFSQFYQRICNQLKKYQK